MLDTLFGLISADSRGQQWVADELQLVNWGGYDGAHRVKFSPGATMLVGGSGSGKSTLMDAYIALMMPHTTPFNGASNGGVTGRPRGEDQRNILSYGRGKIDESRTAEGTKVRVLRGDGVDTWTAIAMTWLDHDGSKFTALRAWYIPASARVLEDTVRVRAVAHGDVSIEKLEEAAARRLSDSAVRKAGLETIATDREFSARIHSVLGIGAAGGGSKAMNLLARIQSGQQITTVDELYKRMVLEEPETLATADAVVHHFDELAGTRVRMVTAQRQVRMLTPIRGMRSRIDAAAATLGLVQEIGVFTEPDSLASLWRNQRRLELLRAAEEELSRQKAQADQTVRTHQALAQAAESEREGLQEVLRSAEGDQLAAAERELAHVERKLAQVQAARARLDQDLATLGERAATKAQFDQLLEKALAGIADPSARTAARDAYAAARGEARDIEKQIATLEDEQQLAEARHDSIPQPLHESRALLAEATGLSIDELPFVGELIEVSPEFEPWRAAFNLALGSFATTLLVDRDRLAEFRTAINAVRTPVRIRFEGAVLGMPVGAPPAARTMPGRLTLRDSEFAGWLAERLERQHDYVCVDESAKLADHAMALTITGQVSQGVRGSHGGQLGKNVLGFSNAHRLTELASSIYALKASLAEAKRVEHEAAAALDAADARLSALGRVAELDWAAVDTDTVEAEQQRWTATVTGLGAGNQRVEELQAEILAVKKRHQQLQEQIGRAKSEQQAIAERWSTVVDEVDDAQQAVDDAADAERALSAAQAAYLSERFDAAGDDVPDPVSALAAFDAALATAGRRLQEDQAQAQATLAEQLDALRRTFESFLEAWPNPTLLADPQSSYRDFERILTDLEASGLHELEAEWRSSLLQLSGNDLTNLDSMLARSLREINERIEPVNRIMQDLPFYDDDHRLQITTRENQSEARRKFRKELREVRQLIASAESDGDRLKAYERMSRFIDRIRRQAPDFADLVDVRNHVRISAEKIDAVTGEHAALYDHIGEKSGGESQELVAFIVGAALRYQLGDPDAERPRYAPVFLDEALIKADAHFTKRAIGAWRGLGFQLIIGAPNDKYSAIEPHVEAEYTILKDVSGRSWAKPKVALP